MLAVKLVYELRRKVDIGETHSRRNEGHMPRMGKCLIPQLRKILREDFQVGVGAWEGWDIETHRCKVLDMSLPTSALGFDVGELITVYQAHLDRLLQQGCEGSSTALVIRMKSLP